MTDDSDHPVFDRLEEEAIHAAQRVRDLFEPHHRHTETPAQQPATMKPATQQEDTMLSISQMLNDAKTAVENGDQWFKQVAETHLPAIVAEVQKYENSPVVQALEGAFLTPEEEAQIAAFIGLLAKVHPAEQAAPAEAQQPAEAPAAQ